MPSKFTVKIDYDVLPSLEGLQNADVPLKDIANRIIQDVKRNIRQGRSYRGTYYKKLADKTIKDKIREGAIYPKRALYRTGKLFKALRYWKVSKNNYQVGIAAVGSPRRDNLARIHQEEGVNRYTRTIRSFFGISNVRRKWARQRLKRWIKNVINKEYTKKRRKKITF